MISSIIDDITLALDSASTAEPELLADMAAEYSEAVVAVNRRLRDIARLLERGHRSEAIQMAELEPPVLNEVASLDFPRLDEWVGLLLNLDMETPPLLNHDLAELIDSAYTDQRPMEILLRRHRALAIAKAPLGKRIQVLSQLLQRDPGNAGWTEDMERWQTARLAQIRVELREAMAARDYPVIEGLDQELSGSWSVPVPKPLVEEVEKLKQSYEIEHARKQLEKILPELDKALSAHDVVAGCVARDQWRRFQNRAALQADHPIMVRAEEALAWLDTCDQREVDENEFSVAIRNVEQAIEKGEKLQPFLRAVHSVERLERPWPVVLQKRVAEYRHALERSRKRNTAMAVAAGIAVIALAAWFLFQAIHDRQYQRRLAESVKELSTLHQASNWQAAADVYENLPEAIRAEPSVTALWSQITAARDEANQKLEMFRKALAQARDAGVDTPDYASLDSAEKLIQNNEQRLQFDSFAAQVRDRQNTLLEERNQQFSEQLAVFVEKVRALVNAPSTAGLLDNIDQLAAEITTWKSTKQGYFGQRPIVSPPLLGTVDDLLGQLKARHKIVREALDELQAFQRIDNTVGDANKFRGQLEIFCNTNPNHRLVADFRTVVGELNSAGYMEAFVNWKEFLTAADWATAHDPAVAARLLQRGNELLGKHPAFWLSDCFNAVRPCLELAATANDAPVNELKTRIKGPLWDRLGLIVLGNDDPKLESRYYLPGKPVNNSNERQSFFRSLDFVESKRFFPTEAVVYAGFAPHKETVDLINRELDQIKARGWQVTFLELAKQIATASQTEKYAETLIYLDLLTFTLEAGVKGDFFLKQQFQPVLDQIRAIDRVDVDWIAASRSDSQNVNIGKYQAAIAEARKILGLMIENVDQWKIDPARNEWQKPDSRESESLALEPIGWLLRNNDDTWSCSGLPAGIPDQKLYCMILSAGDVGQAIRPIPVGTITAGVVVIDESSPRVSGRPVYGRRSAMPSVSPQSE